MSTPTPTNARLEWIAVDEIVPTQPFPEREVGDLTELTSSMRLHGVLTPLVVRPVEAGGFQVVCGYRRYLAAKAAELPSVPVLVRPLEDAEAIRCYLSEKMYRSPLSNETQTIALETLRRLRDGRAAKPKGPATPREVSTGTTMAGAPGARRVSSRWSPAPHRSRSGEAVEAGAASCRAPAPAQDSGYVELLRDTEEFLESVLEKRGVSPQQVEPLVDRLLELRHGRAAFSVEGLYASVAAAPTAAHGIVVALLCAHLAEFLGWQPEHTRRFVVAGFLHDCGMVFVDGNDVTSGEAFTREQREALPKHTRVAEALIRASGAWAEEVALCARDHHERFNGTGYPESTCGEEVSLEARLMAYLDTYAALVSPRAHRDALAPGVALERLEKAVELGLYDPRLFVAVKGALQASPLAPMSGAGEPTEGKNTVEIPPRTATMLTERV